MFTKAIRINSYVSGENLSYVIETSSLKDLSYYSSPSIVKELVMRRGSFPRHRIAVLNKDETIRYYFPESDIMSGGSYNENYQNGQRRSCSFSLYNQSGKYTPSINTIWEGTKIQLESGLQIDSALSDTTIWFPKGVYVIQSAAPSRTASANTVSVEAADKFSVFENSSGVLGESLEIQMGTLIEDFIKDLLGADDGTGYPRDPKECLFHSSFKGRTLPLKLSFSAGENYGSILTQLSEVLSAEIFYDASGHLTLVPVADILQDNDKPLLFSYREQDGTFQSEGFQFNFSQIVNQVYVVGANVNGHLCTAMRVNDDPASPLCYQRIGYHVGPIVNDSNITSDYLAEERAEYELRKVLINKTSFNSTVFFNPLLAVNNLIGYTDSFFGLEGERMLITGLSYSLDYSGTMQVTGSNIKNLPFTVV